MKYFLFIMISFFCASSFLKAQTLAEVDSIFGALNLKFSPIVLERVKQEYKFANDTVKAIMLKVYSMPTFSRQDMIENYEDHKEDIATLQEEFNKSIPNNYIVSLGIEMSNDNLRSPRTIDIQIFKKEGKWQRQLVDAEWGVEFNSPRFYDLIHKLGWDVMTFSNIKNFMQMANCVSIKNEALYSEIGFAHSGLGKYTYIIFPSNLSKNQAQIYNDGCKYKFYKDNIVLKYEGGMAGPQCFTD